MNDDVQKAITILKEVIAKADAGLPEELFLFVSSLTPLINVDLLIQDEKGRTLLTWRDDVFYGPGWHVPGGIIRYKEKIETRIRKVAEIELGAQIRFDPKPVLMTELISKKSAERGHFMSLLYFCTLITLPNSGLRSGVNPTTGQWAWHDGCPENLIPAHEVFRSYIQKPQRTENELRHLR